MFEMEVVADYVDLSSHWLVGMVHKKRKRLPELYPSIDQYAK